MRRDAGEEGGREFCSKMPRTMSNLPDFPRRPFLYAHLFVYTKSMLCTVKEKFFVQYKRRHLNSPLSVLQVTVMATPSLAGVRGWSMPAGEKVQPCNHANIFKGTVSCDFSWFYHATNHGRPERRNVTSI